MKTSFKMLAGAAAVALSFSAQALVIDTFATAQNGVLTTRDTIVDAFGSFSSVNGLGIIGGQRDLFVIETDTKGTDDLETGVRLSVFNNELGFSSDVGQAGVGIVRWDGGNTSFGAVGATAAATLANAIGSINATGLGSQNFAGAGIGFIIDVVEADIGFAFSLQAYSSAGNYSTFSTTALGAGSFFIPFSAFGLAPGTFFGTGADFGSIGALQALINFPGEARANVDLRVRLAQVQIPEPTSLALVGLALLGLGGVAAKRRATK